MIKVNDDKNNERIRIIAKITIITITVPKQTKTDPNF
jgi:hypothetical protein